jgi:hypothetical protein
MLRHGRRPLFPALLLRKACWRTRVQTPPYSTPIVAHPVIFDFGRWDLSRRLPGIIHALTQRKCYHTGRGNFFTIQAIDQSGKKVEYEVFFNAYIRRDSKKAALNLIVQSAYVRDR